ncbi:MAG: tetratricopeptide repeat protein, partial [Myxococcales bacterium]|nr:tetratricopeptide repeat protein [Myxococcales bacterium]
MAFSKPKAHERAERYAAKGQHDKAAREYQQIVEHDPKDIRAWLMLADCLGRTGDKPGAIERYERVAKYYVGAKEDNKALAVFRQVLNLDPQRIDIQTRVAALHLKMGNLPDAIGLYERIGHVHMQQGRIGDALATYKIVADADPSAVAKRLRLAELYSREKKTADAVEAFRLAGDELRKAGRVADYVRVAERLLFHDAKDLPTIRQLAQAYLELGDPRRALMKLNGLLRSNPSDEEGIELLAETFMMLGKPEKALSALEELARGLRARGPEARDASIRILRRGLEWRPAHAEFRDALAELEGRRATPAAVEEEPAELAPGADDGEAVDELGLETLDEGDLVELDEDDLVMEEPEAPGAADQVSAVPASERPASVDLPQRVSAAPGTRNTTEIEAIPSSEPSLTQSVLSEVEGPPSATEALTDFDKILFEARVYIKYRLFEHALDHIQTALAQQPDHVGALSLAARALTEVGRPDEAADAHVRVAELVQSRDPKLAKEHVGAARALVPDHPRASALHQAFSGEPRPAPAVVDDEGDSGAFDLVSEGLGDFVAEVAARAKAGRAELDAEPAANLVDAHDEPSADGESTQPFTPIDLSIQDDDEDEDDEGYGYEHEEPARTGRTLAQHGPPGSGLDPARLALARGQRPEIAAPTQAIEIDPEHTDVVVAGFEDLEVELEMPTAPVRAIDPIDEFSLEDEGSRDPGPSLEIHLDAEPEPSLELPLEPEP